MQVCLGCAQGFGKSKDRGNGMGRLTEYWLAALGRAPEAEMVKALYFMYIEHVQLEGAPEWSADSILNHLRFHMAPQKSVMRDLEVVRHQVKLKMFKPA